MKPTYLLLGIYLVYCFSACKPDFDLNAPYKDVTVVYGVLNYQDSKHYVKIYKGYQSHKKGGVFIDALNPDSIYYYDKISVVLQEYNNDKRTSRPDIPMYITNDFQRDSGFFYSGDAKILYCTEEPLLKDYSYKIVIKHNNTGKITEGMTRILGNGIDGNAFEFYSPATIIPMLGASGSVSFYQAQHASDYELHVNFLYFEVDTSTKEITHHKIVKNICPRVGDHWEKSESGYFIKNYTKTFYKDIEAQIKPNPKVIRYIGTISQETGKATGSCIELEGWAAGESMYNFLLSNQPTHSFVQVNTIYTNLSSTEGLAFGFFSSTVKCPKKLFATSKESEDTLIMKSKVLNLGFKPYIDYKP